jgi:hypothetical protein
MTDASFVFALAVGASVLAALLTVAHMAASRLEKRREEQRMTARVAEPELDFGHFVSEDMVGTVTVRRGSLRQPEEAEAARFL